ncbi:hypothetical protein D9M70_516050 [compost metagenome]
MALLGRIFDSDALAFLVQHHDIAGFIQLEAELFFKLCAGQSRGDDEQVSQHSVERLIETQTANLCA